MEVPPQDLITSLLGYLVWRHGRRGSLRYQETSIQRHAAADVGGHVEVFAVVNGRLALLEAALGNDLQRQHALAHLRPRLAIRLAVLLGQQLFLLVRAQVWRGRNETRRRAGG